MEQIKIEDVTVTTFYFDIGKRDPAFKRLDFNFFKDRAQHVINIPVSLILYTDPEYLEFFEGLCKNRSMPYKLIGIPFEETPGYKNYDMLKNAKHLIHNRSPQKDTALYTLVQTSKYYLMNEAVQWNPFRTPYFSWVDLGLSHVAGTDTFHQDMIAALSCHPRNFRCVIMNYPKSRETDFHTFCTQLSWLICGGFSLAPLNKMKFHCERFITLYEQMVQLGYCVTDENVTSWLLLHHPEDYEVAFGDYASIIKNFPGNIKGNQDRCLAILRDALVFQDSGTAREIIRQFKKIKQPIQELANAESLLQILSSSLNHNPKCLYNF